MHEYDPLADTWTRRGDFPTVRSHFEETVTVLDGRILTAGGFDGYSNYEDVLSYAPGPDCWTELCRMPLTLGGAAAKAVGNVFVVAQGETDGARGPETATRTTVLNSTPSTVLAFSRPQLTAQVAAGGTATAPNLLWTLSGTASYVLSSLPTWLAVAPGTGSGQAGPLGQAIDFRVNAAGLVPGTYSAAVQATAPGYAPTTTTLTLTVTAPLATVARRAAGAVSVYPNPAASHATVAFYSLTAQVAHLEVHSSHGQLVWQGHCRATAGPLPATTVSS